MKIETTYIYSLEYPLGNIRYIGKSDKPKIRLKSHIYRRNDSTSHKNSWISGLIKNGHKPIINIIDKVPLDEWQFWEQHYIFLYKSFGFKLTNLTFGGDGLSNATKDVADKISKTLKETYKNGLEPWNKGIKGVFVGVNSPNWGKIRTDQEKEKQRQIKLEYYKNNDTWNKGKQLHYEVWNKGKKGVMPEPWNKNKEMSDEVKSKVSEATKKTYKEGRVVWNKGVEMRDETKQKLSELKSIKVVQFSLDGEFIREWDNVKEPSIFYNCDVCTCCTGRGFSAGGFLWMHKDKYDKDNSIIFKKVELNKNKGAIKRRKGKGHHASRAVVQLNKNTLEEIKVWDTASQAEKELNTSNIGRSIKYNTTSGGFRWKYLEGNSVWH